MNILKSGSTQYLKNQQTILVIFGLPTNFFCWPRIRDSTVKFQTFPGLGLGLGLGCRAQHKDISVVGRSDIYINAFSLNMFKDSLDYYHSRIAAKCPVLNLSLFWLFISVKKLSNTGHEYISCYFGSLCTPYKRVKKLVKLSVWRRRDGRKGTFTQSAYLITVSRYWRDALLD